MRNELLAHPLPHSVASSFCSTHLTLVRMLGFLRRIRRSLIEEGHLRKYLVYAIGEILLVVLGILIALQVNNWNEARKESDLERQYLEELAENLSADINELKHKEYLANRSIYAIESVLEKAGILSHRTIRLCFSV